MAATSHDIIKKENQFSLDTVRTTHNSITLKWEKIIDPKVDCYEVRYREKKGENEKNIWKNKSTDGLDTEITIDVLKPDCMYEFKLVGMYDGDFAIASKTPSLFKTKSSLASCLQKDMQLDKKQQLLSGIAIYQFNTRETNIADGLRKCEIIVNQTQNTDQEDKTVLMIGETGVGKSSFIDALINNLTSVSWNDEFRFKLISLTAEENSKRNTKVLSQTETVTWYRIPPITGSPLNYFLNIIDTPGFGDTSGLEKDKAITTLLQKFFEKYSDYGYSKLNAICFVVKSDSQRLTVQQNYIFDCLSLTFGKGVRNNICIIATHADTTVPLVLKTLRTLGIPTEHCCQFDNRPLEECVGRETQLAQQICQQNFHRFYNILDAVKPCTIASTVELMHQRQNLDSTIEYLLKQVDNSVVKVIAYRLHYRMISDFLMKKISNLNYSYSIPTTESKKFPCMKDFRAINCKNCNRTCHYPCDIKKGKMIWWCIVMDFGKCITCPSNCPWSLHTTENEYIARVQTMKEVVLKDILEQFNQATEGAKEHDAISSKVFEEIRNSFSVIADFIKKVDACVKSINENCTKGISLLSHLNILLERQNDALAIVKDDRKYILMKIKDVLANSNDEGCQDLKEILKSVDFIMAVINEGMS